MPKRTDFVHLGKIWQTLWGVWGQKRNAGEKGGAGQSCNGVEGELDPVFAVFYWKNRQ